MSKHDDDKPGGLINSIAKWGIQPPPPPPSATKGILDVPVPSPADVFKTFFARPTVKGLYYNGRSVTLDGYRFEGCRFDNCTLVVLSTNFELIDCVIDPTTSIQYSNDTAKIVKLFNSRHEWAYAQIPGLAPRRNSDGTITIGEA